MQGLTSQGVKVLMEIEHETFCIQKAIDMIFPMDKYGNVYLIEVYHQVVNGTYSIM